MLPTPSTTKTMFRAKAETAITMVRLDDKSTRVITDEKTMLG